MTHESGGVLDKPQIFEKPTCTTRQTGPYRRMNGIFE